MNGGNALGGFFTQERKQKVSKGLSEKNVPIKVQTGGKQREVQRWHRILYNKHSRKARGGGDGGLFVWSLDSLPSPHSIRTWDLGEHLN